MAKCKKLLLSCLLGGAACIALGAGLILRGGTPVKADDNFAPAYTGEFNPQYFTYWAVTDEGNTALDANMATGWKNLTKENLSSDSSDADGVSLHLNSQSAIVTMPRLAFGTYKLSYSAKSDGVTLEKRIGLRLEYVRTGNTIGDEEYWIENGKQAIPTEWTEYSFDISTEDREFDYIGFQAVGNVCIDNLRLERVVEGEVAEEFNYVPNGSFSAAPNLNGYVLGEKASVVPQKDGTAVFIAGRMSRQAIQATKTGTITIKTDALPQGENISYTASLECRLGINKAVTITQDGRELAAHWAWFDNETYGEWIPVSAGITPGIDLVIEGSQDPSNDSARPSSTYIRNISLKGSDGTEYILNKDLTFKEITYNDGGTETTQERVWGDTEVAAENPTEAGEVFVGWVDSLTEPTEIYRKGSTIQGVTEDKTLYALYVDYSMTEGASIWLGGGAEQSGIRWNTTISAEDKAVLDDLKAVYGTRVVSDDDKYADVTITEWCKPAGGRESFNTVLRNITRDGFDTVMEARSYIEITLTNDSEATRIYADVAEGATKRTIAQVAQAAIANGEFADDAEKLAILKEIAGTEVA